MTAAFPPPPAYVPAPIVVAPKVNTRRNIILGAIIAVVLCVGVSAAVTAANQSSTTDSQSPGVVATSGGFDYSRYTQDEIDQAVYVNGVVMTPENDTLACRIIGRDGEASSQEQFVAGFLDTPGNTLREAQLAFAVFRDSLPC